LIRGRIPDILDLTALPVEVFIARGYLIDLKPFLIADPEFNSETLIENVLRVAEVDGALYHIFPEFGFRTIIGNTSVLGEEPGWNMEEFKAVLNQNPDADLPMGSTFTRDEFLSWTVSVNMSMLVNRDRATVHFDSDYFISLLELAATFPEHSDHIDAILGTDDEILEQQETIGNGRQIMVPFTAERVFDYRIARAFLGRSTVFKGIPSENREGTVLISAGSNIGITTRCEDAGAAWEFVRIFLTEDFQRDYVIENFPVNRVIWNEMVKLETHPQMGYAIASVDGHYIQLAQFSVSDMDLLLQHIESITTMVRVDESLWNIISESASNFFNGQISAQDAARIIQNRASIYISEQSG
jgi:ABC-type glycerol-3-phosphate transport system substrate-binding protein